MKPQNVYSSLYVQRDTSHIAWAQTVIRFLSRPDATILKLHYQGYTDADLAQALRQHPATVKTRRLPACAQCDPLPFSSDDRQARCRFCDADLRKPPRDGGDHAAKTDEFAHLIWPTLIV